MANPRSSESGSARCATHLSSQTKKPVKNCFTNVARRSPVDDEAMPVRRHLAQGGALARIPAIRDDDERHCELHGVDRLPRSEQHRKDRASGENRHDHDSRERPATPERERQVRRRRRDARHHIDERLLEPIDLVFERREEPPVFCAETSARSVAAATQRPLTSGTISSSACRRRCVKPCSKIRNA